MNGKSKYVLLGSSESFVCLKNNFQFQIKILATAEETETGNTLEK